MWSRRGRRPKPRQTACLIQTFLGVLAVAHPALAQRYEARLAERPPEFYLLEVADLNNQGEMVGTGYRFQGSQSTAVFWRADGSIAQLPYLPHILGRTEPTSNAYGINDRGEIVGRSSRGPSTGRAVMWPNEREVVRILRGSSVAVGINNSGAVVGYRETAPFHFEGFVWGHMGWSPILPLLQMQYADAINDRGQVVGESHGHVPLLWENRTFTALPTLGRRGSAFAISQSGIIGGSAETGSGAFVPVRWVDGEIRQLPIPVTTYGGYVSSINERGDMAGVWLIQQGTYRIALWRNNLMMEPNDLLIEGQRGVWSVGSVNGPAINDVGQIATGGWDGVTSGVVRLDPVDIGLTLIGFEPSRPGRRNDFTVNHATPGGRVSVLWGTARGEPTPLEQCPGAMIDIADPRLAATGVVGPDGRATISVVIPAHVEGTYILQAVDHRTCDVSPPAWALLKLKN